MSEFRDAIGWRGGDRYSFTAYGVWEVDALDTPQTESITGELKRLQPAAEVSSFVASDEGWPCAVGVFDIELGAWPAAVEDACEAVLDAVCRGGARLAWMMFEGMFNEVADMFSPEWARHIYAIKGNCNAAEVEFAVADSVRHSPDWEEAVASHRERVLGMYPRLRALET